MPTITVPASEQAQTLSDDIVLPTGEQIYDSIMSRIEPELVLANLETLDEPYAEEAPAQRQVRYARYAQEFEQYREQYKAWILNLNGAVDAYRKAVLHATEEVDKSQENLELESLGTQMLAA